ncbi:MAG: ABC transporter permease [Rubrivivax sp.]|nr:ABC transporter permease [Rubrivivax sp.]
MKALVHDAWRSLRARGGATAVAGIGLVLALAASLLVALLALALADVDPSIPEPERVVVLDFKGNPPGKPGDWHTASPVVFGPLLKARQVPLDHISRMAADGIDIQHEGRQQPALLLLTDPDAVNVLGLRTLAGDLRAALAQRDGIAISAGLLRRLWGELPPAQALGRPLNSRGRSFTVAAVLPDTDARAPFTEPNPMVGNAMAMVGFESQGNPWSEADREAIYMVNGRVFARLRPGTTAEQVGGWMREAFIASPGYAALPADWRAGREAAYFRAVTLTELPFEGELGATRWFLLGAMGAACALLLGMAAFNHMNLLASGLLRRQRETALRRSLGAGTAQLLALWAMETLLVLAAAAAGGLFIAWWAAPAVANALGLPPTLPVADPMPPALPAGLLLAVALLLPLTLAGPAAMALRRAPAPALQGRTASEGPWGRRVRQGLLTLQLSGALLLAALAGVLALQQQHLLQAERGFETRGRYWLGMMTDPERVPSLAGLTDALNRHPAVKHWAFSNSRPGADTRGQRELHVGAGQHKAVLRVNRVSSGFFATFGMPLLAGSVRPGEGEQTVVLDAKAARALGFATPQAALGAQIRGGGGFLQEGQTLRRVVAVVRDVKLESAREPALPQAFVIDERPQWDLTVHGPDARALRAALDEVWKAHGPPVPHTIRASGTLLADAYQQEGVLTQLLVGVAVLALAVAAIGAYALVADTLRRRSTELVLRRLHGAGPRAVAAEVLREFALPLGLALLLALPLAAVLGEDYLAGFVDRIGAAPGVGLPVAAAALLTLGVVVLAALRHLQRALALQPVEALG